jgi:hypothetical protein
MIHVNKTKIKNLLSVCLLFACLAIGSCNNQTGSISLLKEQSNNENCLENDDFNLVKKYIEENGVQIKLYKAGMMSDTNTISKQIFLNGKTIALISIENYNKIIVIDKFNVEKNPVYYISTEENPCAMSAYYSRLDTDEDLKVRNNDWCEIINKIKNAKKDFVLVDKETSLKIAEKDADISYRDLSIYNVKAELKENRWYVDYNLSNPDMLGGGPHYVICAKSGSIITRRYEQ